MWNIEKLLRGVGGSEKASQDLKRSRNWFIYCTRKVITILGGGNEIVFEHASHFRVIQGK